MVAHVRRHGGHKVSHEVIDYNGLVTCILGNNAAVAGIDLGCGVRGGGNGCRVIAMVRCVGFKANDSSVPLCKVIVLRGHGIQFEIAVGITVPAPIYME